MSQLKRRASLGKLFALLAGLALVAAASDPAEACHKKKRGCHTATACAPACPPVCQPGCPPAGVGVPHGGGYVDPGVGPAPAPPPPYVEGAQYRPQPVQQLPVRLASYRWYRLR